MPIRPGVNFSTTTTPPSRATFSNTGRGFIVGLAERGPTDKAIKVRSLKEFVAWFGGRVSYGYLYDAADLFFLRGGTELWVVRVVGPAAAYDTIDLPGAAAAVAISVRTVGQGDSPYTAQIIAGQAAGYRIRIADANGTVEESYDLADNDAAVAWAEGYSKIVRVVKDGAAVPIVQGPTPLATGTDDRAGITDAHRTAGLAKFRRDSGPGQVSIPGATTTAVHTALLQHAKANARFALCDSVDSPTRATILAQVTAQRAAADTEPSYGILVGPWAVVPGIVRKTERTVPYSIIEMAAIARSDAQTGNPNIAVAGSSSEDPYVIRLTQEYSDTDLEALNEGGVAIAKMVYGACRLYGFRTMADQSASDYDGFLEASAARLRMAISAEALFGGEEFAFDQIDGAGQKLSEWAEYLEGILYKYWLMGALFGEASADAYVVDAGPNVNTPDTITDRQLNAVLAITPSPFAEQVNIELSRRLVNQ